MVSRILLCCALLSASPVLAATVLDDYLTLPQKYLAALGTTADRTSLIRVQDLRNGYLELEGAWEGNAQVALWTGRGGQRLLGVVQTDCGPVCHQTLYFLKRQNGRWVDVTRTTFSPPSSAVLLGYFRTASRNTRRPGEDTPPFLYTLPRVGTAIEVVVDPTFTDHPTVLTRLRFDAATMRFTDLGGPK